MYWEEDEGGVERYALRSASGAIPPETEGIWVGDIGVESVVKFIKANGVEDVGLGGEVLK